MGNMVILIIITFILNSTFFITPAFASKPQEELLKIRKKLQEEKQKMQEAIKEERSMLSELEEIEKVIKETQEELNKYTKELSRTESKIRVLENEISNLNKNIGKRSEHLKKRLRTLYKQQTRGDMVLILISSKDYQELLKRSRYISLIAYHDSRLMEKYSIEIKKLDLKKKEMETLKEELSANKDAIRERLGKLKDEKGKKDRLLASIRSKKSDYERMIKELEESSKRLETMIEEMEKEKAPFEATKGPFSALRGRLPWPVNGEIIVPFGKYRDPRFNILVFKNGIEIESDTGEYVRAVHDGRVVYADWFKGYGQLLIITHGDGYHSLYGNLSEIFYKTGDIIKRGDPLGSVGQSGISDTPTLYFEIRHKGKPVDPTRWLMKKVPEKKT